ncbi:MAG: hypothetical protein ACM34K_08570 [Bacillota bacterium]
MKYLLLLFVFLSVSLYAQLDSLDRIELKNNRIQSGKIIKITSDAVQFREAITNVIYEYQKSEIRNLKLSNGTILSFNTSADQGNVTGSMQNPQGQNTQGNTQNTGTQTGSGTQTSGTQNTGTQPTGTTVTSQGNNPNTTGTAAGSTTSTNTGSQTNQQTENQQNPGGLSTTALILLGASGVIVLLLLGSAIF